MLKKLHTQLTFLCTFASSTILVFMSLICLSFSESESKKSYFSDFQINANLLYNHLGSQSILSRNWLAQFQADTGFEMDIQDNGSKLAFEHLSPFTLNEDIFTQARTQARQDHAILEEAVTKESVLSTHAEFSLQWEGLEYYASVALIPKQSGVLNVTVLLPLTRLNKAILSRRQLFAGVDILGVLLLGLFFWIFTWRMMQPLIKNRQKQAEFIASASHELRSPLTVMLSALSAMQHASPKETAHFSQTIKQEGKRMGRLIDDMLTLSSTDSSRFSIQKTAVELDTLLLSAYEKFEPVAQKKSLSLHVILPDKLVPPYYCDKERIEQVLSILLDNALCYTPSGGRIVLSLETVSNKFTLRVSDSGIGIPDSEKQAVFDRFYRCDKAHKDKEHFGLGLCIAQEIIHLHKGNIWVENTPGGGSSFVIVLS
ncbi:sensor histidine kinase [Lachnospiraceae bacterium]|nr:sensor histidine kinase [Lachnospiraceae bacterium]